MHSCHQALLNFQALIQGRKAAETLTVHRLGKNESLWCRRGEPDTNHAEKGGGGNCERQLGMG